MMKWKGLLFEKRKCILIRVGTNILRSNLASQMTEFSLE